MNMKAGRYSSGQRGQTVNLLTMSSQVRILLSPRIHTKSKQNTKLAFLFCVFLYFQSVALQDQRSQSCFYLKSIFYKTKKKLRQFYDFLFSRPKLNDVLIKCFIL